MIMREIFFDVQRLMAPHVQAEPKIYSGRLTLTFYMQQIAGAGASGDLMTRYNQAGEALSAALSKLLHKRLLLGKGQKFAPPGAFVRLPCEADCGALGTELIRNICPNLVAAFGFRIERLAATFSVFEKAMCYPRRPPDFTSAYDDQEPERLPNDF